MVVLAILVVLVISGNTVVTVGMGICRYETPQDDGKPRKVPCESLRITYEVLEAQKQQGNIDHMI